MYIREASLLSVEGAWEWPAVLIRSAFSAPPPTAIPRPQQAGEVVVMEEILAFMGILLGCLARSLLPFMRKLRRAAEEGRVITWDHRYTATFLAALLMASAAALLITPSVSFAEPMSPLIVFCIAFAIGFGSNGVLNELVKQAGVI